MFADGEENKKTGITSVGLKQNIKDAGKSEEEKAEDDDEVQMEDPSEDVTEEGDEGKKSGEANASTETKLAGALAQEEAAPKYDYSLLDMVTQFLYEDAEPLPILCGYFTKILDQLLDKQKQMTLEYLLLHGQGKIFNGLL